MQALEVQEATQFGQAPIANFEEVRCSNIDPAGGGRLTGFEAPLARDEVRTGHDGLDSPTVVGKRLRVLDQESLVPFPASARLLVRLTVCRA